MAHFEGGRPVSDAGPNEFSGGSAGQHWFRLNRGSNPRLNQIAGPGNPPFLSSNETGEVERVSIEAKPASVDECTQITVFLIQDTMAALFNPASGFMEFGISLYKADGTTLLGTAGAHIPNDYDPTLVSDPGPEGIWIGWEAQSYVFTGLSLNQADIDAGLIVELDSTAPDGWVGPDSFTRWRVYAVWLGYEYTASVELDVIVEGASVIEGTCEGWAPIATARGDSPIVKQLEGVSVFEQEG